MMKTRLLGVSALALAATLTVAGCDRGEQTPEPTTGAADTTTLPDSTAQAPATVPPADGTASTDSAGPGETMGAALDDATVTAKVKAALLATDGISGTDISVETQQGRVILTGRVPDQAQAQRAAEVAGNVEGVQGVDNRIEVAAG